MKLYRYNARNRSDRRFNTTGREKNPNSVKFYARSLDFAKKYETIYNEEGEELYKCELEIIDLDDDAKLFDMPKSFQETRSYKVYVSEKYNSMLSDYSLYFLRAKTKKEKNMWRENIDGLKDIEKELAANLFANEFQELSDFKYQDILLAELKDAGFVGYFTKNEVALF